MSSAEGRRDSRRAAVSTEHAGMSVRMAVSGGCRVVNDESGGRWVVEVVDHHVWVWLCPALGLRTLTELRRDRTSGHKRC